MNILFVSSGNKKDGISPIVLAQGIALSKRGITVEYFTIKGKGLYGYFKNIPQLRNLLKLKHYHLVHAHFSLSAIIATFAFARPLIVSLMGSDVYSSIFWKMIIKIFMYIFWDVVIVKSVKMKNYLKMEDIIVIPNGVDLNIFRPIGKEFAKKKVCFEDKKYILFVSDPMRAVKNFKLAKLAFDKLEKKDVKMKIVYDVPQKDLPFFYSGCDVLLCTSKWEGSPNIIKEAMACNCPIVSTDVGDVREIIGDTKGCFIAEFDPKNVAKKIEKALAFGKPTNGRVNIRHLESGFVADKIISIYNQILKEYR